MLHKNDLLNQSENEEEQPKQLTRIKFKNICEDAMDRARSGVVIANQVKGYNELHNEEKNNDFVNESRIKIEEMNNKYGHSIYNTAIAIKKTGAARCSECQTLYAKELTIALKEYDVTIMLVNGEDGMDHAYLNLEVLLEGETVKSRWHADAWNPAFYDMSTRPDGTIRNKDRLIYGIPEVTETFSTMDKDKNADPKIKRKLRMFGIVPAKPGKPAPGENPTPYKEMLKKHEDWLYPTYTTKRAMENGYLSSTEELALSQTASPWQKSWSILDGLRELEAEKAKKAKEQEAKEQANEQDKFQHVTTVRPRYRRPS
jgi:hypothetical protein